MKLGRGNCINDYRTTIFKARLVTAVWRPMKRNDDIVFAIEDLQKTPWRPVVYFRGHDSAGEGGGAQAPPASFSSRCQNVSVHMEKFSLCLCLAPDMKCKTTSHSRTSCAMRLPVTGLCCKTPPIGTSLTSCRLWVVIPQRFLCASPARASCSLNFVVSASQVRRFQRPLPPHAVLYITVAFSQPARVL